MQAVSGRGGQKVGMSQVGQAADRLGGQAVGDRRLVEIGQAVVETGQSLERRWR